MYEEPLDKEEAINATRGKLDYIESNLDEFETLGGVWSRIFHTNYEFTVMGKIEDQEACFKRFF